MKRFLISFLLILGLLNYPGYLWAKSPWHDLPPEERQQMRRQMRDQMRESWHHGRGMPHDATKQQGLSLPAEERKRMREEMREEMRKHQGWRKRRAPIDHIH